MARAGTARQRPRSGNPALTLTFWHPAPRSPLPSAYRGLEISPLTNPDRPLPLRWPVLPPGTGRRAELVTALESSSVSVGERKRSSVSVVESKVSSNRRSRKQRRVINFIKFSQNSRSTECRALVQNSSNEDTLVSKPRSIYGYAWPSWRKTINFTDISGLFSFGFTTLKQD